MEHIFIVSSRVFSTRYVSLSCMTYGLLLWHLGYCPLQMHLLSMTIVFWNLKYSNISQGSFRTCYITLLCIFCRTCVSTQVRYRHAMTRPFAHLPVCPFVNNWLVSATPPTVFGQSFWNFTDVLAMACRCAFCLLIILRFFFFSTFSALLT